jgi:hypothetical protein
LQTAWSVSGSALEADKKEENKNEKYPHQIKFRIQESDYEDGPPSLRTSEAE